MYKWAYVIRAHAVLAFNAFCGLLLLPVLITSHRLQEKFFALVYRLCQWAWRPSIGAVRRSLLARLNDIESHDSSLKSRGTLRVLEVGAAYGENIQFFLRPVEYWKVEPNTAFEATFQKKLTANPKVRMERSIWGYGEDMRQLPDGHFDAVVLTYVLCSARDSRMVLSECKRVLTKHGPQLHEAKKLAQDCGLECAIS